MPPPPAKIPYAELAAGRGFRVGVVAWSAATGAAFGLVLGWTGALLYLVPLVPVCVVLLVDRLAHHLPADPGDPPHLRRPRGADPAGRAGRPATWTRSTGRAGAGWSSVAGSGCSGSCCAPGGSATYASRGCLGPALGYLGWSHLVVGLFAMVLLGGLGGAVLTVVHRSLRRRYPYGPFMVVGAGLAVVSGPWLATESRLLTARSGAREPRERLAPCCAGSRPGSPTAPR